MMVQRINIEDYLAQLPLLPIIDVRTPAEFESGHIPGAVNIPLFSNEERAKVGTVYKQESRVEAFELGYKFVEPKLDHFVTEAKKVMKDQEVVVYCWRGGMRSRSFAEHIESNGVEKVSVIEGGYKAFRTHALETFLKPDRIFVLGGYTGSGKTRILKEMKRKGEQVIDLEGIAHHKGSAFGGIDQGEQPKNEHFTNLLYWEWKELDMSRPVWVEDESIHIGRVFIPEVLFGRMRDEARVVFLDIPKERRADLLVEEYAGSNKLALEQSILRISKRLGGVRTKEALDALERKDYHETAVITLDYYDKFYLKGLKRRDGDKVILIPSDTVDEGINAELALGAIAKQDE